MNNQEKSKMVKAIEYLLQSDFGKDFFDVFLNADVQKTSLNKEESEDLYTICVPQRILLDIDENDYNHFFRLIQIASAISREVGRREERRSLVFRPSRKKEEEKNG